MLRAEGNRREGSPVLIAGGRGDRATRGGRIWAEAGTGARDGDGFATCRHSGDCLENKAWYEPLFSANIPLSLFSFTESRVKLSGPGNPLCPELHPQNTESDDRLKADFRILCISS